MLNLSKLQFKISVGCLFTTIFFSMLFLSSFSNIRKEHHAEFSKSDVIFDFTWVKASAKKYPELNWFTSNKFLGRSIQNDSLLFTFKQLDKNEYNSFEKLIFMLYHLRLFIDCDYAAFQQMALFQDRSLRLEFKAFYGIKNEILDVLKYRESIGPTQMKQLLELALIYSQIHLSQKAQDKAYIYEFKVEDNNNFFTSIKDLCPSFFPTFESLNSSEKLLLQKLLCFTNLNALFSLDLHKKDLEQFKEQREYANDENLFDLVFFLYRCYCPGAHILSLHQDIFYHQRLHNVLSELKKSCLVMQSTGIENGLSHFINAKRASFELNPTSIIDLVLEPLFLKLYFLDKKDLHTLRDRVTSLCAHDLSLVITYLKDDCCESSSFFMKIIKALFEQKEGVNLAEVFQDALDVFVKVLAFVEKDSYIKERVKVFDDSHLIKALRTNPETLMAKEISIDHRGTIRLKNN